MLAIKNSIVFSDNPVGNGSNHDASGHAIDGRDFDCFLPESVQNFIGADPLGFIDLFCYSFASDNDKF